LKNTLSPRKLLRHTYRSWLDAVGTSIAVQQKLMRHADIRTTMNAQRKALADAEPEADVYGDIVTDEMEQAHSKVVRMALAPVN
jgi:integrase